MSQREYKFFRKSEGRWERVIPERWGWGVVYNDGTEFRQFGDDGIFHQFGEIDQSRVGMFVMYQLDDMSKRFDIAVNSEMKLIHFYKKIKPHWSSSFITVYVFGYEKNIDGKNQKVLNFIMPDDHVVIADTDKVDLMTFGL